MSEPASTRVLVGRVAGPGFAAGPLRRMPAPVAPVGEGRAPVGSLAEEIERLRAALAGARGELLRLAAGLADDDAAAMIEFQIALLEDDELSAPVEAAILGGMGAARAWSVRLDGEIDDYRASGDAVFAARAADLLDLRDRVARRLAGLEAPAFDPPEGAVVLAPDITPSAFLAIAWKPGQALVLEAGSPSSHVAILARARGLPMLVGVGPVAAAESTRVLLDGDAGTLILAYDAATEAAHGARAAAHADRLALAEPAAKAPAVTRDGREIAVLINIAGPTDLAGLDPAICDGIGLTRTEFLFHHGVEGGLPDEAAQLAGYAEILAWAGGRRVVIRTLDAGGDKPIPGLTPDGESNPFLGLRGVRLSLARPEVFRVQLRALLRAAALAPLDVMVPMVTVPAEIEAVRRLMNEEAAAFAAAGIAHGTPRLGMMVEVPAAALTLDLFDVDFVSIGSNDLTQYVCAAGRDSATVAGLAEAGAEAVLRLIALVVRAAEARGIAVGLCGDVAADPAQVGALTAAGLTCLSMTPGAVARVKAAIRSIPEEET